MRTIRTPFIIIVMLTIGASGAIAATAEGAAGRTGSEPSPPGTQQKQNMLSIDLTLLGGTAEYARRIGDNRLFGFGGGVDAAFLGYMIYAGNHFAEHDGWSYEEKDGFEDKNLLEIFHANLFIRHELLGKMHVDTGLRSSLFMHFDSSDDDAGVGIFAGPYITVMYGWQHIKFGSRVQAGVFWEDTVASEFGVFLSPFIVRIALPW